MGPRRPVMRAAMLNMPYPPEKERDILCSAAKYFAGKTNW